MAGRNSVAVATNERHFTKSELAIRKAVEEDLGKPLSKTPPKDLPEKQKPIWKWLVGALEDAGFLFGLDEMSLREACDVIVGLKEINAQIQQVGRDDRTLLSAKVAYNKMYVTICGQLGLSPQARAKLGSLSVAAAKDKEDPLLEALSA